MKQSIVRGVVLFLVSAAITGIIPLGADERGNQAAVMLNHYAARNFIAGAVSQSDLETILQAGVRAPSANNRQPWQFTVVRDQNLAKQILSNVVEGNVLIIISAAVNGNDIPSGVVLDCALATESIYLAAQALGLGSRIYTGPIDGINRRFKADLGLPNGYNAVAMVRVGRVQPGTDAVSSASNRKPMNTMVNYK